MARAFARSGPFSQNESDRRKIATGGGAKMLWTIVIILLVLWLLGLVTSYTLGGVIHVLLVIALVVIVINLLQGRRAL
jgi:hypothetical protein